MADSAYPHDDADCTGCALPPSRRDFLRNIGMATVGALVMSGIPSGVAEAMTPSAITPRRKVGSDVTYAVPAEDGAEIDKDNEVILVRWQGTLVAFNLSCPHQNTALKWREKKNEFECPKHHSRYQPTGAFIAGRATRNMDRFPVTVTGTEVVVHTAHLLKSDADAETWAKATAQV